MWPLTGREVSEACRARCLAESLDTALVEGISIDSRRVQDRDLFVAVKGEKFDGHNFVQLSLEKGAAFALVSSSWFEKATLSLGERARCFVVEDAETSFREFAKFFRNRFSFSVIGIGGSNGKTTTKDMLHALLSSTNYRVLKTEKSQNGFVGIPVTLTSREMNILDSPHALVLEIGIDEKDTMQQHVDISAPDLVLLTALGPEHLTGLGDWATAVKEELKLFSHSPKAKRIWQFNDEKLLENLRDFSKGDVAVIDEDGLQNLAQNLVHSCRNVSRAVVYASHVVSENAGTVLLEITKYQLDICSDKENYSLKKELTSDIALSLPGRHNQNNLLLAFATAAELGRTDREILQGWKGFHPPEMRSNIVTLPTGNILFNDCYNANPTSMQVAIEVVQQTEWSNRSKILILGDMLELGNESKKWHLNLKNEVLSVKNMHLCLYGSAMYDLFEEINKDVNLLKERNIQVWFLSPDKHPKEFFEEFTFPSQNAVILVKGSRSMDLGRAVEAILKVSEAN